MAAPVDVATLVYAAVWTALTNSANFIAAFPPGNQIRFDAGATGNNSILRPQKLIKSTSDLPQIEMMVDGGIMDSYMFKTLAQEQEGYSGEIIEEQTIRMRAIITSQDQRYVTTPPATPGTSTLLAIFQDALRVSGPKLGTNYLLGWGPIIWDRKLSKMNGMYLNEDTLKFPVKSRFGGQNGVLTVP
jgi:hypothetical protein